MEQVFKDVVKIQEYDEADIRYPSLKKKRSSLNSSDVAYLTYKYILETLLILVDYYKL